MRIAIDTLGGDYGLSVTLPAVCISLKKHKNLEFLLFGPSKALSLRVKKLPKKLQKRLVICNAFESIAMADSKAQALKKTSSSMYLAIDAVVKGRADAFISAGNTNALTAICEKFVPMCKGVSQPAFISEIPAVGKPTFMLDLGARLEADAKTLVEYALMGQYCASALTAQRYPKIALLNVGKEDGKGVKTVQNAHKYLKRTSLNYHGFIEGHELFNNSIDVIVCDGKTGNISLKTAEGTANLMVKRLKETLLASMATKAMAMPVLPLLKVLEKELNPNRYNGAILLGLSKVVAKSHGSSNAKGIAHCIDMCITTSEFNLAEKIEAGFQTHDLQGLSHKAW